MPEARLFSFRTDILLVVLRYTGNSYIIINTHIENNQKAMYYIIFFKQCFQQLSNIETIQHLEVKTGDYPQLHNGPA